MPNCGCLIMIKKFIEKKLKPHLRKSKLMKPSIFLHGKMIIEHKNHKLKKKRKVVNKKCLRLNGLEKLTLIQKLKDKNLFLTEREILRSQHTMLLKENSKEFRLKLKNLEIKNYQLLLLLVRKLLRILKSRKEFKEGKKLLNFKFIINKLKVIKPPMKNQWMNLFNKKPNVSIK